MCSVWFWGFGSVCFGLYVGTVEHQVLIYGATFSCLLRVQQSTKIDWNERPLTLWLGLFRSFRFGLWRFCPPTFVCSANRKRNQEVEAGRWKVYQPPKTHISLKGFLGPCTYSIYLIELRYLCAKWISRWIAAHVWLKLWPDPIM